RGRRCERTSNKEQNQLTAAHVLAAGCGTPSRLNREMAGDKPGHDTLMSRTKGEMSMALDFTSLFAPGLPPAAAKWNGFAKYNFIGGHNDADQVPLASLIKAANDVLTREGRTLATYGLSSGPLGYRPLREFLARKLEGTAGIRCDTDEILITSGSLQALDLVNGILLARGDTVIIEQATYQG